MWDRRVQGKALSLIKVGFRGTEQIFLYNGLKKKQKQTSL